MHYQKPILAGLTFLITSLFACTSNEIGESKDVNQDKIYMDYDISYAEGDDQVTINLQYRFAGSAGTTLVLNNPSQVKLDGEIIKVDSSDGGGAYYEVSKNYSSFLGKHVIQFTDINGKQFENSFEFTAFAPATLPASASRANDLVIAFNTAPLGKNDYLALTSVDTDSSFHYQQDGPASSITIPANELKRQKDKQVSVESMLYREIPLSQTTSEGGKLQLNYRLKPVKINLQP
jgi:hypothetical protein